MILDKILDLLELHGLKSYVYSLNYILRIFGDVNSFVINFTTFIMNTDQHLYINYILI